MTKVTNENLMYLENKSLKFISFFSVFLGFCIFFIIRENNEISNLLFENIKKILTNELFIYSLIIFIFFITLVNFTKCYYYLITSVKNSVSFDDKKNLFDKGVDMGFISSILLISLIFFIFTVKLDLTFINEIITFLTLFLFLFIFNILIPLNLVFKYFGSKNDKICLKVWFFIYSLVFNLLVLISGLFIIGILTIKFFISDFTISGLIVELFYVVSVYVFITNLIIISFFNRFDINYIKKTFLELFGK